MSLYDFIVSVGVDSKDAHSLVFDGEKVVKDWMIEVREILPTKFAWWEEFEMRISGYGLVIIAPPILECGTGSIPESRPVYRVAEETKSIKRGDNTITHEETGRYEVSYRRPKSYEVIGIASSPSEIVDFIVSDIKEKMSEYIERLER